MERILFRGMSRNDDLFVQRTGGHWPRESGYRASGRGGQPVLGVRAVPPASAA
jgi:hypothetical protein